MTTQEREAFLSERALGIGGSDMPVVLGISTLKTPLLLWMEKTGRANGIEDNPILRRGRALEAVVRSEYEIETNRKVVPGKFVVHPEHPWMVGHLDGVIVDDERGPGVFEGKSANVYRIRDWDEEAPLGAQIQCLHYQGAAGLQWGSVAGLLGGLEFKYQDLDRNEAALAMIIERGAAFWKLVQDDTPPEPVAADASTLGRLYEAIEGRSIELPEEAVAWDRQRLEADSEMKRLKELKDEADAKLKFAIGAAEIGILPGGGRYTFKTRKAYDVAAFHVEATRTLRRASK
jgi:putative phage-type endonuclease